MPMTFALNAVLLLATIQCAESLRALVHPGRYSRTMKMVSELHIPGYAKSKLPFIHPSQTDGRTIVDVDVLQKRSYSDKDYDSLIPFQNGHLLHKTRQPIFTIQECDRIVQEAEERAFEIQWTTNRHGNYPTTDLPLVELPKTLAFLQVALAERIYPLLTSQFGSFLPDPSKLRVADGFVVKYDAKGGQTELKPNRDGSVLSLVLIHI